MKLKKLNKIPQSVAKDAYELLGEVKKVIVDEPKRYCQDFYLRTLSHDLKFVDNLGRKKQLRAEFPSCGTIGCVAGWVVTLKQADLSGGISEAAASLLGIGISQRSELFHGSAIYKLDKKANPGTVKYARLGARHIERFRQKYKAQLKAKSV